MKLYLNDYSPYHCVFVTDKSMKKSAEGNVPSGYRVFIQIKLKE
jgi:hypothetical protein